ncbi:MAG: hypothetical protein KKD77_24235, partial [Gammaproteobacteria bacterium]|nr:hypothetical protein [Gammaproteobacteria bacterium]
MTVELDYMEYANDAAAQAAYVSSKPFSYTLEENYESGLDHYRIIFGMGGNSEKVAQEFQLSSGITCGKISAYLKKVGNPADNVTCRVETDAAGKPSGNLVHANATKSIAGSGISGAGDWANFEFAATFSLSSGTVYHIVILRSGARDTNNYYGWGNSEVAGSYPDGSLEYSNNGVWDNLLASDGYFRIYSAAVALQCYSESGVVQQGTYSLAVAANSPDALNQTLIRTIGAPIDLSGMGGAYLYIRTTLRTGSNIKIGIHDSGGVTTEITPNVAATGAWQKVEWVLTGVADADKDAIDQIIITIVNADASEIFFLDNIYAIAPVNVTVEPDPLSVSSSLPAPSITEGQGVTISADPFSISASIPQVEVATGIASFATLASIPNSQKDFMCVITPKKRYTAWTKTGGQTNVYQMSWANLFLAS